MKDTYKTIEIPSEEILFKEKNSKFYGYSFPITLESEVKPIIDSLRKKHPNAGHFCYAYQIGTDNTINYRTNDDGEPNNTAGTPIYGQILSFQVTNILVVVVRFFGGVKLGVGGLISAYKNTAQQTLEAAKIIEKIVEVRFIITLDYKNINKVMRIIKEKNIAILNQKMEMSCEIEIISPKKNAEILFNIFNSMFEIEIRKL